jgi:hypothetical protein
MSEEERLFFFEKKNQKTFVPTLCLRHPQQPLIPRPVDHHDHADDKTYHEKHRAAERLRPPPLKTKSFLVLFFKKEHTSSDLISLIPQQEYRCG